MWIFRTIRRTHLVEGCLLAAPALAYMVYILSGDSHTFGYFSQPGHDLFLPLLNAGLFNALTFYVHGFRLVPRSLLRGRWIRYCLGSIGLLVVVIAGKSLGELLIIDAGMPSLRHLGLGALALENLIGFAAFLLTSGIYGIARHSIVSSRTTARLEQDRLRWELATLRSQINPHFLFNTLNTLYSLGLQGRVSEVTDGIAGLSGHLRYMLYECQESLVPLEKELDFLEHLVAMHRMMFGEEDGLVASFVVDGDPAGRKIAPLLLSPLVENAFKHGIRLEHSSFVEVRVAIGDEDLSIDVRNSMPSGGRAATAEEGKDRPAASGLGLANLRQRLELLYPGRHRLELTTTRAGVFRAALRVAL